MAKKVLGAAVGIGLIAGLCILVYVLSNNKVTIGYNKGYMPDQPVAFSHEFHAGKLGVDCRYCHSTVDVSHHAAVPALNVCMNCHNNVKKTSDELDKLKNAYNSGKSIAWENVHLLPDFVRFNHSAHIKAGKQCNQCHGPVETMTKVYQHESLSMGWCVQCHRQPENNAPTNCSTCHY